MIGRLIGAQARYRGARTAIVDGQRTLRFAELADRSARLASAFAGSGAQPGDRILLLSINSIEFIETVGACAIGGFVSLALNTRLGLDALVEMVTDADARIAIVDARLLDTAEALADRGALPPTVIVFGESSATSRSWLRYDDLLTRAAPASIVSHPGHTPLMLTATSGTTGRVKMTVHSHQAVFTGMNTMQAGLAMTPADRLLTSLPMFFATATGGYWLGLFVGAETHLQSAFQPAEFVNTIGRSAITHSIVGPSPIYLAVDSGADLAPLRQMKYLGAGGAAFNNERFREIHDLLGGVIGTMYSMSEVTVSTMLMPADVVDADGAFNDKVGSVGRPQPGTDVIIVDDDGNEVPGDGRTPGELIFRAPGLATRYWSSPDESAMTFVDGGVRSGDIATVDPDGFIRIVDRKKDLIVSGGINIAPAEIEATLHTHPGVAHAAVIGIPHATWGEAIHAVVVRKPGSTVTENELIEFAAARLASVKKPRSLHFVDALPTNTTGKVLRRQLRDEYRGQ